jgi:quinol monooxygenase YgiN
LDELYTDDAAVEAHRAAPNLQTYLSRIGGLAARVAVTSHPVYVI